jgi:hypothetical protein
MFRRPDPMRAFEGLNLQQAEQLASSMGYTAIVGGGEPRYGEIGLVLDQPNGKVLGAKLGMYEEPRAGPGRPTGWLDRNYPRSLISSLPTFKPAEPIVPSADSTIHHRSRPN